MFFGDVRSYALLLLWLFIASTSRPNPAPASHRLGWTGVLMCGTGHWCWHFWHWQKLVFAFSCPNENFWSVAMCHACIGPERIAALRHCPKVASNFSYKRQIWLKPSLSSVYLAIFRSLEKQDVVDSCRHGANSPHREHWKSRWHWGNLWVVWWRWTCTEDAMSLNAGGYKSENGLFNDCLHLVAWWYTSIAVV